MANQFPMVSPGAAISETLRQIAEEEEVKRMRAFEMEQARAQMALQQAQEGRMKAADTRAGETHGVQLEAQRALLQKAKDAELRTTLAEAGPGGKLAPAVGFEAEKRIPAMVERSAAEPYNLPAQGMPEMGIAPGQGDVPLQPPDEFASKGTKRQQIMELIGKNPDMDDRELMLKIIEASGDDNIPASAAGMLSTESKDAPIFRRNTKGELEQPDGKGGWTPYAGTTLPERAKVINEPNPASAGMPFSPFVVYTAQGLQNVVTDKRDGSVKTTRIGDNKPGEAAIERMAGAEGVIQLIGQIRDEFDPAKVGVITGRLKTLDSKLWGSDPEYAKMKTMLSTLGNTVIQLRTGAQMSVQEAERIMNEVANENLPPATFMVRLNQMDKLYRDYLANRAKISTGRLTEGDVTAMTEGRLPSEAAPGAPAAPATPGVPAFDPTKVRRRGQ